MKRAILLVPFVVLGACADSPFEPDAAMQSPRIETSGAGLASLMAPSFSSSGGVTLGEDTGCTRNVEANTVDCAFTAQNLTPGLVHGSVGIQWSIQYQCVHSKNGNTNRQHPPSEKKLWRYSAWVSDFTVDGQHSGSWTRTAPEAETWVNFCSGNKGQFTTTKLLVTPTPVAFDLFVWSDLDDDNWAYLVGDLD